MDSAEAKEDNADQSKSQWQGSLAPDVKASSVTLDAETLKSFFRLTGGSILYCLSAMGPILSSEEALKDALPCILTLHVYEIALLAVLILIVSRKVVDDAISITILIALFLIGGSMALGSVADKDISVSFYIGLLGIALASGKLFVIRRFVGIRFRAMSALALIILVTCNYLGPILMARSISASPAQETARRDLWLFLWLSVLLGAGIILIEAMKTRIYRPEQGRDRAPFLRTPLMVYIFALIVVVASGVHQYSMAFTFALERVIGDFMPVTAVATLLLLEILRHSGKRFGIAEIVVSCVPLAVMLLAISEKSVLASGRFGPGLVCYPPVVLALSGLSLAGVFLYHRRYRLMPVVAAYGLGIILTAGFSPNQPHDLNVHACLGTITAALLVYGIIARNQGVWILGISFVCLGLGSWDGFSTFVEHYDLTPIGSIAGVFGLGSTALYLFLGRRTHPALQILGTFCLAGFVFDFLPEYPHWRYLIALFGTGLLAVGLWLRAREIPPIIVLCLPSLAKLYTLARCLAYWRFVILGFLVLGAGTLVSLLKRPNRDRIGPPERENAPRKPQGDVGD